MEVDRTFAFVDLCGFTAFQVGRLTVVGARWTTPRWLVEGAP